MQPPIADYALIGDTRTAALCSKSGSIDWLCLPRFDSDPVFSRLIDDSGPHFTLRPVGNAEVERRYEGSSTVLETTYRLDTGVVRLREGMVSDLSAGLLPQVLLVRDLECLSGQADIAVTFDLRPGLPGRELRCEHRHGGLVLVDGSLAISLCSAPALDLKPGRSRDVAMRSGERLTFALSVAHREPLVTVEPAHALRLLNETRAWWEKWAEEIEYSGAHRDSVVRSLVTLRLLTYSPSGAPVASPTTSLPERLGGERNWDYRYAWPRDASIGISSFRGAGKTPECHAFLNWLVHASRLSRPQLGVLYNVDGRDGPKEHEMVGLSGYRGSLPVRRGNGASGQHQLDVYGWVVAAVAEMSRSEELNNEVMGMVRDFADYVCENWRRPDAGIWERRDDERQWVHSKLMAGLTLDRALEVAPQKASQDNRQKWTRERNALAEEIVRSGWDPLRQTYLRSYGSTDLDASLLSPPLFAFEKDPQRLETTVQAIRDELGTGGPLLYRYRRAEAEREGAFLPCSFWLVQALTRLGRIDEADTLFAEACGLANDVGLLPEEIDPETGEFLGNFPLAFTHATLVQAALDLKEATRK